MKWYPSVIIVTTETVYKLKWSEGRVAATFTTSHEPVVVGGPAQVIASFLRHLFRVVDSQPAPESTGPELLFSVPEGYRPVTPVTLQVETRPLRADGSAVPGALPLHLDVRLDPQGSVYYLNSAQAGQVAQHWGQVAAFWGFTVTGSWPAAEATLAGVYDSVTEHFDGRFQLRRQGDIITAELSSTRSPVVPAGGPPAVLFTVPEAYRPAVTVTRVVTGDPVDAEGQPFPSSTESLQVRVQIRPDGTVRYAPADAVRPAEFGSYTLHTSWSTNVAVGDRLALAIALDIPGAGALPEYVWTSLKRPSAQWQGVTTNADGRITHLDLNQSGGSWESLSAVLGDLTALQELVVSKEDYPFSDTNRHGGSLPPEVGNLTALTTLQVTVDSLVGKIPPELGKLANLEVLHLTSSFLEGPIPPELGQLANLRYLDLSGNDLSGPIPAELGHLTNLVELVFMHNNLEGPLPPELGHLAALEKLWFESLRALGPIPPEWGQLQNLRHLIVTNSGLSGALPAELGHLTNLTHLVLTDNQLRGPLPSTLGQLRNLQYLDLSNNTVDGRLPPELGQLTSLVELVLKNNNLEGPIPPELGQLTELGRIDFINNNLEGPIPLELGQLPSLVWLYLGHNQLWGPIPWELFFPHTISLMELDLSHNQLWGSLPLTLGWSDRLGYLDLSHNQLEGAVLAEWNNLQVLHWMNLAGNKFSGCLPSALHTLHARGQVESELPLCGE